MFIQNADATENLACSAGNIQSHGDVVTLGHRDLHKRCLSRSLELGQAERHELGSSDFICHQGEFSLHQLKTRQWLPKLMTLHRVGTCLLKTGLGSTKNSPGDPITGMIQALQR